MRLVTVLHSPTPRTNADISPALRAAESASQGQLQEARAVQDQARAAQARAQAEEAQRQIQQEMRDARREIDRAVREAMQQGGRGTTAQIVVPPFPGGPQIPEGAVIISVAFFVMCAVIAVGLPIARAFSRRMDRRNAAPPAADADTRARLERIEQAVDAIAVEVERISEGQRYTTNVLGDLRALPQPDPSVAVPDRVAVPISRAREAR